MENATDVAIEYDLWMFIMFYNPLFYRLNF